MTKEELESVFPNQGNSFGKVLRLVDPALAEEDSSFLFQLFKYRRREYHSSWDSRVVSSLYNKSFVTIAFFIVVIPYAGCVWWLAVMGTILLLGIVPTIVSKIERLPHRLSYFFPLLSRPNIDAIRMAGLDRFSGSEVFRAIHLERSPPTYRMAFVFLPLLGFFLTNSIVSKNDLLIVYLAFFVLFSVPSVFIVRFSMIWELEVVVRNLAPTQRKTASAANHIANIFILGCLVFFSYLLFLIPFFMFDPNQGLGAHLVALLFISLYSIVLYFAANHVFQTLLINADEKWERFLAAES